MQKYISSPTFLSWKAKNRLENLLAYQSLSNFNSADMAKKDNGKEKYIPKVESSADVSNGL